LQGQTNIVGIINILLNSRTQIKNVQPQMDLVIYPLKQNHQDYIVDIATCLLLRLRL